MSERETQIPHDITYTRNLKYNTNEHIYETERLTGIENRRVVSTGEGQQASEGSGVWD